VGRGWDLVARVAAWYRALGTGPRAAVIALLAANLIPIVGVLFFGWSLMTILLLYWLENGIVGAWNVPRIAMAKGEDVVPSGRATVVAAAPPGCQRAVLVPFFLFHYGMFWLVHGIFLFVLPAFGSFGRPGSGDEPSPFGEVNVPALLLGGAAMVVSHGVSFFANYLGRGEYRTATPTGRMMSVYGRVVVLHLTILFGAFAVAALGSPIAVLVILVVGKTILDLSLHWREHRAAAR